MQTGQYLYSQETVEKAKRYLEKLKIDSTAIGSHLNEVLNNNEIDVQTISAEQLILHLINTKKPKIFAESEVKLDGSDWNEDESSILGDIVFSTTNTHAYNNGHHTDHKAHETPIKTNFIFVAGALLRNSYGNQTADMKEILVNGVFNVDAFYILLERRLLPGLLMQNNVAKQDNIKLVINIPFIGKDRFLDNHSRNVDTALPRVLKLFFEKHIDTLDMIHTVNYDPYIQPKEDEFTSTIKSKHTIKLMNRPSCGLPDGAPGEVASQLEYPKDGTDYSALRLIKIVAWDHFAFPGNNIWINDSSSGNGRRTDDGISFASSNVILAMIQMGQFNAGNIGNNCAYDTRTGIFYLTGPNDQKLGYKKFAEQYSSRVRGYMISPVANISSDSSFGEKKLQIQKEFMQSLRAMQEKTSASLLEESNKFLGELTVETTETELKEKITDFRNDCKEQIEVAEKIIDHGWLYNICEMLIKAVIDLFVSIGMAMSALFNQGSESLKKFSCTFFSINKQNEPEESLDKQITAMF